jgi:RNA polymerase sigma-70 factor (ECF subfamily)
MADAETQAAATRWTLVLRAGSGDPASREALAELCALYWQPVFRFLRGEGRSEEVARELTQEFFARLLASGSVAADPGRGRFRSYLFGAVKHFLQDARAYDQRLKRGGGLAPDPLPDESTAAGQAARVPAVAPTADAHFDREWALHVLERALATLAAELRAAGKGEVFHTLKPWLTGASADITQAQAAAQLGISEGAVKVAIHRLRLKFRELVRRDIAATVDRAEDVDDEVRYLVEVLAHPGPSDPC